MYVLGVTITLYYIPLFAFGIRTALFVENCTLNNRTSTTYSGVVAILPLIKPVIINISLYTMISYENETYDDECAEKKVLISFLYKHLNFHVTRVGMVITFYHIRFSLRNVCRGMCY